MDIWNGFNKAFTLSYDDGVESDRRFLDIINYYGLKCTFNLNSGILGTDDYWVCDERLVVKRLPLENIQKLYEGHEIAVHGKKHLAPPGLNSVQMEEEFLQDCDRLEQIFGIRPVGMAYAYGAYNEDNVEYLKSMGLSYGRTVEDSLSFELQEDLMRFKPTCHHNNEDIFRLLDEFIEADAKTPKLFYLWGHSYEFDAGDDWKRLERICEKISSKKDVFYGTNRQVFGV